MMPFLEELKIFGGEPFACRTSRQIMFGEQLRRHPQIHLSVISNGTLLDEKTRARLRGLRLGWFEFSLDGCTQETYESIRIKGKHSRTFSNIEAFVAERDKNNLRIDKIYISFVVQRRNYHEVGAFVRYATQLGVIPVFSFVTGGDELVGLSDEVRSCLQEGIEIAESLANAEALDNLSALLRRFAAYEKSVKSHRRRQEVKKTIARFLGSQNTEKLVGLVKNETPSGRARARLRPDA
jgi:sulfatase maturation enzyme AslB (radical SAM superfamily)